MPRHSFRLPKIFSRRLSRHIIARWRIKRIGWSGDWRPRILLPSEMVENSCHKCRVVWGIIQKCKKIVILLVIGCFGSFLEGKEQSWPFSTDWELEYSEKDSQDDICIRPKLKITCVLIDNLKCVISECVLKMFQNLIFGFWIGFDIRKKIQEKSGNRGGVKDVRVFFSA